MKRRILPLLGLVLAGWLLGTPARAQEKQPALPKGPRNPAPSAEATGELHPALEPFDSLMHRYMDRHDIPGAALAVLDHGRLVHARGYGYADKESGKSVTVESRFRIASISKMITAAGIMKLVEQNKLALNTPVFDIVDPGSELADQRHRKITVEHLLRHRGGWDRGRQFDPMFESPRIVKALGTSPPASATDTIKFMAGQPLNFDPGVRMAYSNFGYCLLGRVIEERSGQPYESFMRQSVLAPLGIERMQLGRTLPRHRARQEVHYYDPNPGPSVFPDNLGEKVERPYGVWNIEAMDAHGGWIASVMDLARFTKAFMGTADNPALSKESISRIFSPPAGSNPARVQYGFGWLIRTVPEKGHKYWHTGSLGGNSALVVLRHDQRVWIVLFNSRVSRHSGHLARDIDPLLHKAANEVDWPEHYDLFSQ